MLFTLIAERYERRTLGITSNLVFAQWEHIFANPMATAAAIDRVIHHSVILEFDVPRYRTAVAQQRGQGGRAPPQPAPYLIRGLHRPAGLSPAAGRGSPAPARC